MPTASDRDQTDAAEPQRRVGRAGAVGALKRKTGVARIPMTPQSRFRLRADGGMDETYRINFVGQLQPYEMRSIVELLLAAVGEGAAVGIQALTKVKFVEPDTCEYTYWCSTKDNARVNIMMSVWYRLNRIHPVAWIDNIQYDSLFRRFRESEGEADQNP